MKNTEWVDHSERNPVEEFAESFVARYRRGEEPRISEYTEKYPEHAAEIRELFPALPLVERLGAQDNESSANVCEEVATASASAQKALPRQLGEYVILREVGRGGMGVVYEAEQKSLGRRVALKVLPFHRLMDDRRLERFQREARAAAALQHPNIVPVFGVGEEEGVHYYTMQFIPGQSLDEVLNELRVLRNSDGFPSGATDQRRGNQGPGPSTISLLHELLMPSEEGSDGAVPAPSPGGKSRSLSSNTLLESTSDGSDLKYFRNVATLGVHIAEALDYAHGEGVIHRDIKPSNLLLEPAGQVWVTDFGLAKSAESDAVTLSGEVVGTLAYMAPERLEGWSDPRSDLYSLGVTLYELLTLRAAFEDSDRGRLMKRISEEEPKAPRLLEPRLPRDLETVVLKAMEKEPARRYRNMEELAGDLNRYLRSEPLRARRPSVVDRLTKWSRRHQRAVLAALLILVLAFVGLIFSSYRITQEQTLTEKALTERSTALTESQRQAYVANVSRAGMHFHLADPSSARESLDRCPPELRGWEWRHLDARTKANFNLLHTINIGHRRIREPNFSARGNRLVALIDDVVKVWDVQSGELLLSLDDHKQRATQLAFSPEGSRFVSWTREKLRLWRIEDGDLLANATSRLHSWNNLPLRYSPNGELVAMGGPGGEIQLWRPESGQDVTTFIERRPTQGELHWSFTFTPDSRRLVIAFGWDDGKSLNELTITGLTVEVWEVETRKRLSTLTIPRGFIKKIAFDSDARRVAVVGDQSIQVWAARTGTLLAQWRYAHRVTSLAFSPDGRLLSGACVDRKVPLWNSRSGELLATLSGHVRLSRTVAFHPNEPLLVSGSDDGALKLWDIEYADVVPALRGHQGRVDSVTFSPDGLLLASCDHSGVVRIWDAQTGDPVQSCRGHVGVVRSVAFSPDGTILASGGGDTTVRLWQPQTGELLATLRGHDETVWSVVFDPLGRRLLTSSGDESIRLWEVPSGQPLARNSTALGYITDVAFHPDGNRLVAVASKTHGIVWDSETLEVIARLEGHTMVIRAVAFSPDGALIATGGGDTTLRLWDSEMGTLVETIKVGHRIRGLTFSPDGTRLVAALEDASVGIWDLGSHDLLLRLRGHDSRVMSVAFSPDGKRLASSSDDGTVRIWETELESTRRMWDAAKRRRRLERLVDRLLEEHLLADRVVAALRKDPSLSTKELKAAVRIAHSAAKSPEQLNRESWVVVRSPGAAAEAYARALRKAEAAATLQPTGYVLNNLGVAHYRVGQFAEAIDALRRADDQHPKVFLGVRFGADRADGGGALIGVVEPGAGAELAGLQGGDLVTEFAGKSIASARDLRDSLRVLSAGDLVPVKARRGDKTLELDVRLGPNPDRAFNLAFLAMCHNQLGDDDKAKSLLDECRRMLKVDGDLKAFLWEAEALIE